MPGAAWNSVAAAPAVRAMGSSAVRAVAVSVPLALATVRMVRPRVAVLLGVPGRSMALVYGLRLVRNAVDVARRCGMGMRVPVRRAVVRRRPVVRRRTGVVRVVRFCIRRRAGLPMLLMTPRKPRRLVLQLPERASRGSGGPGGRMRRSSRGGGRLLGTRGRARSRLRCRLRGAAAAGSALRRETSRRRRSRAGGGLHRRAGARDRCARACGRCASALRRRVRRRRDGVMVSLRGGRRRRHDDLGRRRRRPGAGPGRGKVHRARVEQQGHRGRAEQQRNHRRCHAPGDDPECEPLLAFVGRHRPLLPFLDGASLGLGPEIQETRWDGNPVRRRRSLFPGES